MIGDRVVVHIHVVKFGIRSVSQFVSATLGLLTGPRVTDTDDSRESPLRSAPYVIGFGVGGGDACCPVFILLILV